MKTCHSWTWGQNMKSEIGSRSPEDFPNVFLHEGGSFWEGSVGVMVLQAGHGHGSTQKGSSLAAFLILCSAEASQAKPCQ